MHFVWLGKGECFSDKSAYSLSQRVVPPFDVIGFSTFFSYGEMAPCLNDLSVGFPIITERKLAFVRGWNSLPKSPAASPTSVTYKIGHHLAGTATKHNQSAIQTQRTHFLLQTNDHNSSSSRISWRLERSNVVDNSPNARPFFYPSQRRLMTDSKNPTHAPRGGAFLIGGDDLFPFGC